MFQDIESVLAIGAHPDDIEIGCGGFLLKLREMKPDIQIFYFVLSKGELTDNTNIRLQESAQAAHILKAEFVSPPIYPDGALNTKYGEIVTEIEKLDENFNFSLILTHNPYDVHHDHRTTSHATVEALRESYSDVMFYENLTTPTVFNPNFYVDIDPFMDQKIQLLNIFKSQIHKRVIQIKEENIRSLANFRGAKMYYNGYMEAFEIKKMVYF